MKYRIITDSSSNLRPEDWKKADISLGIAPLTIRIDNQEYVDDGKTDIPAMLKAMHETKGKTSSACPSPADFLKEMTGADYYILITLSSKLSGSFNSATVAKNSSADPSKVIVIDSLLVSGSMELIAEKACSLIEAKTPFSEMEKALNDYRDSMNLLFALDRFDNFIKSGRINKILGFLATKFKIKPLCMGKDGEIHMKEKVRTIEGVLRRLAVNVGILSPETEGKVMIISHTQNLKGAEWIKAEVEKTYHFREVRIRENRALCSYYALEGGVIVCF
jgi:DegV family protein with EDD domain